MCIGCLLLSPLLLLGVLWWKSVRSGSAGKGCCFLSLAHSSFLQQGLSQSQRDIQISLGRSSGCSNLGQRGLRLPGHVPQRTKQRSKGGCVVLHYQLPATGTVGGGIHFCNQTVGSPDQKRAYKRDPRTPDQAHLHIRSIQDPHSLQTQAQGPPHPQTWNASTQKAPMRPNTLASPSPEAFWKQAGLPECSEDSPICLGDEVLQPITCHEGRVSGIGGELRGCPLRVLIVGLDEGDVAQ